MRWFWIANLLGLWMLGNGATLARAHFLVVLPADDVIGGGGTHTVDLDICFTHPMEQGPMMEMARPKQFGVLWGGKKTELLEELKPRTMEGKTAYTCRAKLLRPGDHVFYIEPTPYWEPSERKMIIHYTKVVVDFLNAQEGWDAMVGFPVEIEPVVRPYGLGTGNTFRGSVRRNGKPVPFAEIEVEYDNEGGRVKVPNDALTTQVIKADAQGVFSYTMPKAGWWGFAALVTGDAPMKAPTGENVEVELGGLIWIKTIDMK